MKTVHHPYEKRGPLGLYYEKILLPSLERCLGEKLTKTKDCYDEMDFESHTYFVELKTRSDQYHWSQSFFKKDGWLIPSCKIKRAMEEAKKGKKVVFFYFWKSDKSLWRWDFSESSLLGCKEEYPEWHHDLQQQTYIKESNWIRVF